MAVKPTNDPAQMTSLTISVNTANIQIYVSIIAVTVIWASYLNNWVYGQNNMYVSMINQQNMSASVESNAYLDAWIDDVTDFSIIYGISSIQHSADLIDLQLDYQDHRFQFSTSALSTPNLYQINIFIVPKKFCGTPVPYYQYSNNKCYSLCPAGTLVDTKVFTCYCPLGCKKCMNTTYCLGCLPEYYLRDDNMCYPTCLSGFYPDSIKLTC